MAPVEYNISHAALHESEKFYILTKKQHAVDKINKRLKSYGPWRVHFLTCCSTCKWKISTTICVSWYSIVYITLSQHTCSYQQEVWYENMHAWVKKVSKGAKIRNRYNQVPYLTQEPMGKSQTHSYTPQTRVKRSVLSQQVTTRHK